MVDKEVVTKLIMQTQNGSEDAFNELYFLTNNLVYSAIINIINSEELAQELVQETFLKLLQTKMKSDENGFSYLITIAKNLAINTYNKRKREVYINFEEEENLYRDDLFKEHDYSDLNELMQKNLTEHQIELIKLHLFDGLTHKEIALKYNMPIGTIMWQYNEAVKALRKVNI